MARGREFRFREEKESRDPGVTFALMIGIPATTLGVGGVLYALLGHEVPVWLFPYAFAALGLGVAAGASLPWMFRPGVEADFARRRELWLHDVLTQLGFWGLVVNFPFGFYLAMFTETAGAGEGLSLGMVLAVNGLLALGVGHHAWHGYPLPREGRGPARVVEASIGRVVRCPCCAKLVDRKDAVGCAGCKTVTHRRCREEAGSCPTFRCRGGEVLDLSA